MVIYIVVDKNIFKIINTYASSKEAWETIEFDHEGTTKVHMSRLQLLTTKFENLKMKDNEIICEINVFLCNIANKSFSLGKNISEENLARTILRSLSKRFDMKVTTIEEAQDVSKLMVNDLTESLLTFEMEINHKFEKISKSVAFKVDIEENDNHLEGDADEN